MPLYEYACESCDHVFEVLVRAGVASASAEGTDAARSEADAGPPCPSCGHPRSRRVLSAPAAARAGAGADLPVAGCGRPQCGAGGCMGLN